MEELAETISKALGSAHRRSRAELEATAERVLSELAELRRRHASAQARLEEEPSVGGGLGPLGRSTIRTELFAELQRGANEAKTGADRGARLEALERELTRDLADFRSDGPDALLETLGARGPGDPVSDRLQRHAAHQAPVVALLGKVRAAQLHLAALYSDEVHDPYFEHFALSSLDQDERRFLAPLVFFAVDVSASHELPSLGHLVAEKLPVILVRVCTVKSVDGSPSADLPLPYAALAFSPQWTWVQTTWDLQATELPALLTELLADVGRITGPAFVDVLACDSPRQAELAEQCGVWPAVAYFPGDGQAERESAALVRSAPVPVSADLGPASFAWALHEDFDLGSHFVELEDSIRRSAGKPLDEYLALTREERQYYFPYIRAAGQARLVPSDVLRYCEQLSRINEIWVSLRRPRVEPAPPEMPAPAARPVPDQSVSEDALRAALERILTKLAE